MGSRGPPRQPAQVLPVINCTGAERSRTYCPPRPGVVTGAFSFTGRYVANRRENPPALPVGDGPLVLRGRHDRQPGPRGGVEAGKELLSRPHQGMKMELITIRTRNEFREALVRFVLREIEMLFEGAGLGKRDDFDPPVDGMRRTLVEQYYASIDFKSPADVKKLVSVYGDIVLRYQLNKSG